MWQARPMRRKDRRLDEEVAMQLLFGGEYGIMASADSESIPLATPLSYVVMDGKIYFHCARQGQKMDNITQNPCVCFCVVGKTRPLYDNDFTTNYESVLVHGTAALVEDPEEKRRMLLLLCEKYLPQHMDKAEASIDKAFAATAVVCITPSEISGKARR